MFITSDHDTGAVLINIHICINTARPKPVVKVTPDQRVFRGETVTLTCDIQRAEHIQWTYSWFKDGDTHNPFTTTAAEYSFTADMYHSGDYSCRGERSDSQRSDISAAVTLTVSGECSYSYLINTHLTSIFSVSTLSMYSSVAATSVLIRGLKQFIYHYSVIILFTCSPTDLLCVFVEVIVYYNVMQIGFIVIFTLATVTVFKGDIHYNKNKKKREQLSSIHCKKSNVEK